MALRQKDLKMDGRGRICIKQLSSEGTTSYRAELREDGVIELKPMVDIKVPAEEAWIFKNPKAKAMIEEGLEDFKQGRMSKLDKSFWNKVDALEDEDE